LEGCHDFVREELPENLDRAVCLQPNKLPVSDHFQLRAGGRRDIRGIGSPSCCSPSRAFLERQVGDDKPSTPKKPRHNSRRSPDIVHPWHCAHSRFDQNHRLLTIPQRMPSRTAKTRTPSWPCNIQRRAKI